MDSKSGRSGKSRRGLLRELSATALVVAGVAAGALPADAEELRDWQYDTQAQVLTLTLPESVTPRVSVVAPDQLLLEIPDTQVGNVLGQTVEDGFVESIVLEQATPETVWMVMEFAPGTILSTSQTATPLNEAASGEQQWQVRPALVAASRRAAVASAPPVRTESVRAGSSGPVESSASSLRQPSAIAQSPDFSSGLPVLEPAFPMDQPVVVPSLPSAANLSTVTVPPSTEDIVTAEPANEPVASEPIASEPIASEPVESDALVSETAAVSVQVIPADTAQTGSPQTEPPFIGDVNTQNDPPPVISPESPVAIESSPPQAVPETAATILPTTTVPIIEAGVDLPAVADSLEVDSASGEFIASGSQRSQLNEVSPNAVVVEQVSEQPTFGRVTPSNVSRWPEPIPFGQPLPE